MKTNLIKSTTLLITGFVLGATITNLPFAQAENKTEQPDMTQKEFMVSIHEVKQNFVFADKFKQSYTTTVQLLDGTTRTIELTPMIHEGMQLVEFKDTGGKTYMGLNGTTTNGDLMVQLRDVENMNIQMEKHGWKVF